VFAQFKQILSEFTKPERPGPRLLDEIEAVCSVLLGIAFAHLLKVDHVSWAAFSGYMVIRSQLSTSFTRGTLRVLGTIFGAAAAWAVVTWLTPGPLAMSACLAVAGIFTMYQALTRWCSYGWLFCGVGFSMVLLDVIGHPVANITHFTASRITEVAAGTLASFVVGVLSHFTLRQMLKDNAKPVGRLMNLAGWQPAAGRGALHAGLSLALLPLLPWLPQLGHHLTSDILGQAATTILVIMVVPLSTQAKDRDIVSRRVLHRFAGCCSGALLGVVGVILSHGNVTAVMLCVCLGVLIGRHIENSGKPFSYIGMQFTLVSLFIFVPDNYQEMTAQAGFGRLAGVIVGIIILQAFRLATKLAWKTPADEC
jgi:uncharacterized membrane protein YccC